MNLAAKWRRLPEHLRFLWLRAWHVALGGEVSLSTEDRRVFEQVVMPYFAERPEFGRVLFVGCDWYTAHYGRIFAGREYWTLEKDLGRRKFGSERHITDALQNLLAHVKPGFFDLVLCNGVLGWGLNDPEEAERSFEACRLALRPGGVLVLGWNDVPEKRVLALAESSSLRRFAPFILPPLGASSHVTVTANRHTFSIFVRPDDR